MLQKCFLIAIFCTLFFACSKTDDPNNVQVVDLPMVAINTPASITKGQEIISKVKCEAPDLCYSFYRFDIVQVSERQFDIRAKALHQGSVCAQALYWVDTIAKIPATATGQYLLRFYNANQLFKTDTVQVN